MWYFSSASALVADLYPIDTLYFILSDHASQLHEFQVMWAHQADLIRISTSAVLSAIAHSVTTILLVAMMVVLVGNSAQNS